MRTQNSERALEERLARLEGLAVSAEAGRQRQWLEQAVNELLSERPPTTVSAVMSVATRINEERTDLERALWLARRPVVARYRLPA